MTNMQAIFMATIIHDILSDRTYTDGEYHELIRRRYGFTGEAALAGACQALASQYSFSLDDSFVEGKDKK